jgi:hypothetical protein
MQFDVLPKDDGLRKRVFAKRRQFPADGLCAVLGLLLTWVVLLLALVAFAIGRSSSGALTLAYFVGLSLIHVPGVLPCIASGLDYLADREVTRIGFEMTILGMTAFVAGAMVARWVDRQNATSESRSPRSRAHLFGRIGRRALTIGIVAYFVFVPLSFGVPSLTSVIGAFETLLILGFWLVLYDAAAVQDKRRTIATLALLPLLPLATVVTGGFLGYGIYWVLSVIAFLFVIARQRIFFYVSAPLVVYLGLSLFVTYMGQRTGIRELVWQQHSSIVDRLDRVLTVVTQFQMLDLNSPDQVKAIDGRLNQNALVGVAVERYESGWSEFAFGATVPVWALIPRAIWPDKPVVGGGSDVVSDFTGIQFDKTTSVGAGQVLEFYVNFGVPGLAIGFAFLGFALMRLDQGIMRALAADDLHGFVLRAMPGLTLLQPGGNLLEIIVAAAAAVLAAHLVLWLKLFDVPLVARAQRGGLGRLLRETGSKARK